MSRQISTAEENAIMEMHALLNNLVGKYDTHVNNAAIHQLPPCQYHSRLVNRLWVIGTMSITSIIASLWAITKVWIIQAIQK